jgi:soluble lytic murein transglycosylase
MPQTGKSIAQQFDPEEDFHKIHLYDWQTSIDYGARYLADLLREHELAEYAIAEYNAGPKPVKRWKKNLRDNRRETFVEGIDYLQTRHYVKNVLGDYYAYKEMWDGSL